jgi:serine/threonine-protein kinase HipA
MNCLCCGNKMAGSADDTGWHRVCIRRFFDTEQLPEIDISNDTLELLAMESASRGYTVTGVQKKLSLHLISDGKPRMTLVNYPTGYILKPQVSEFAALPESEHLAMRMAEACGIRTVPHALIKTGNALAYITKRVDRIIKKDAPVGMLAMEDFCQLDLRLTQDKYRGSYERCAKIIQRYSSRQGIDLTELYLRLVFSFLIGNSDMHLKNFSLIETDEGGGRYILSPAYDMLPVSVIMPEDTEEFALAMNGKKRNLGKKDFCIFAEACGISEKAAKNMTDMLISMHNRFGEMINESFLPEDQKTAFINLLANRTTVIA